MSYEVWPSLKEMYWYLLCVGLNAAPFTLDITESQLEIT